MHFKSIATFSAKKLVQMQKKKSVRSTKGQHTSICWVRTQRRSHHWPSSGDVWVRACNVWLPPCPSYSMSVVVHIGKQRLSKPRDCHQILTSSRTNRWPAVLSTVWKMWMARATRAGARKLCERIVRRRRDMRRPIPYRTHGTVARPRSDQPLCSDELDEQLSSILCR